MVNVHLCQPDKRKSCAACCGIYNYVDNLRSSLIERFAYRGLIMSKVRSGDIDIDAYKDIIRHREEGKRIYITIYTCEFAGFLNTEQTRVGCMLHPMQNRGNDLRVASFYGRDLCEGHFCPSFEKLSVQEAGIVIEVIADWYLYGVVITDIDFVKTFFKIAQERIREEVKAQLVKENQASREALKAFFNLKKVWPFRDTARPRFGKYFFLGEDYDIDHIDYAALGAEPSPYDRILLSLSSRFGTKAELDKANNIIDTLISNFVTAYQSALPPGPLPALLK